MGKTPEMAHRFISDIPAKYHGGAGKRQVQGRGWGAGQGLPLAQALGLLDAQIALPEGDTPLLSGLHEGCIWELPGISHIVI